MNMLLAQENVQLHLHFKQPATDLKKIGVGIAQVQSFSIKKSKSFEVFTDTQTSMLSGIPESAICVQRFDDSLNSAIHITYRISLRSSSLREPRDPLSKVFHFNTNSRLDTIHGLKMSVPPLLSKERGGKHQEQYSAQNKGL